MKKRKWRVLMMVLLLTVALAATGITVKKAMQRIRP